MPEITIRRKFEVDPAYDLEKALSKEIELARKFLEKELIAIDQIAEPTMQLICMFSLLDSLAQEQANYPWDSKKAFCGFILAHQKQCDYLTYVDPVTLFYRVEDLIEKSVLIPGFPPEKVISLETMGLHMHSVRESVLSGKAQEILTYISQKKGPQFAEKMMREHQMISLLYRMRSKAVHEMSSLGQRLQGNERFAPTEPYYRDVGRLYVLNGDVVSDNAYELIIPNAFIRNILQDCVDGYLSACREKKRFPFENNSMSRKYRLTWYDT